MNIMCLYLKSCITIVMYVEKEGYVIISSQRMRKHLPSKMRKNRHKSVPVSQYVKILQVEMD